jgi:hypothetical protein
MQLKIYELNIIRVGWFLTFYEEPLVPVLENKIRLILVPGLVLSKQKQNLLIPVLGPVLKGNKILIFDLKIRPGC